mgnify:CR=1 FL=1
MYLIIGIYKNYVVNDSDSLAEIKQKIMLYRYYQQMFLQMNNTQEVEEEIQTLLQFGIGVVILQD